MAYCVVCLLQRCVVSQVPGVHSTFRYADTGSEESHGHLSTSCQEDSEFLISLMSVAFFHHQSAFVKTQTTFIHTVKIKMLRTVACYYKSVVWFSFKWNFT